MRLCLLTLLVAACADPGKDTDCGAVTRYHDVDLDGHGDPDTAFETCQPERGVELGDDCDDGDRRVHPGAEEDCAVEIDRNCDGSVGYADADADGTAACHDCADDDPTRFVGAAEVCDGVDQDCDGAVDDEAADAPTWYPDADADGHGDDAAPTLACEQPEGHLATGSDCDDTRADVHPDATEACNGLDDDCDGATDDATAVDRITWYRDRDEDGWGDPDFASEACEAPARTVERSGDCDDDDAAVNPDAVEVCNGVDDDCDGGNDDAEADGAVPWYVDADLDGYGGTAGTILACELPEGGSATADDCDDADATAFPGAPEECDDVDDDCDGAVDDDPVVTWYTDADGDGYGGALAANACEAPEGTVADATDCDDTDATVSPGLAEAWGDGVDDDCDGQIDVVVGADVADYAITGIDAGDNAGRRVVGIGDQDADGFDDLLIGAANNAAAGSQAGAAYLVRGPVTGDLGLADADATLLGEAVEDLAGFIVGAAGDTNGDGFSDLLVGAPGEAGINLGAVYLVHGPVAGTSSLSTASAKWQGETSGDEVATSLAGGGDLDGDGFDDFVVGAIQVDTGGADAGAAYVVSGIATGTNRLSSALAVLVGEGAGDEAGADVAIADDFDGDGLADLFVGASQADAGGRNAGAVYVLYGPLSGTIDLSAADLAFVGESASDAAGACDAPGDVNGDGLSDLLVGASQARTGGAAYLVHGGSAAGSLASAATVYEGVTAGEGLGEVQTVGDVDGDGVVDLLLGAPDSRVRARDGGRVYLVSAGLTGLVDLADADSTFDGSVVGEVLGGAMAGAGDTDGDGLADFALSARERHEAGAAYLFLGR